MLKIQFDVKSAGIKILQMLSKFMCAPTHVHTHTHTHTPIHPYI